MPVSYSAGMQLQRITIFPIKTLDGVEVREARVTAGGILEHDRIYAIADREGKVVNGKRTPRVHALRSEFSADFREVALWEEGVPSTRAQFAFTEADPLQRWLSAFFGFEVELWSEPQSGFPDDRAAFGPTVVSEASLREVTNWFPDVTLESARRRFRANLEIGGDEAVPFWEDRLYGQPETLTPFRIGSVSFFGHNPCQRCAVPPRDQSTGEAITGFQKTFMERRKATLPPWATVSRFNHYYRFAVNTSVPPSEAGKTLRVGEELRLG